MKRFLQVSLCVSVLLSGLSFPTQAASLEKGFANPPREAWPWVYWFWLNGNISKTGITADLEAMKRVGIRGVLIMEVDQGAPVGPVDFMSDQWRYLFKFVVSEAKRLGIEVNMNNDAGWNGSGGPWITPELSMQKVVWSETNANGPRHLEVVLPQPETVAGYYRDIQVLAFPTPGDFRIDRIRAKAAFEIGHIGPFSGTNADVGVVIPQGKIINLTAHMQSGRLAWDVPAGSWTILRFGHTCTGVENAPAPRSGRGLECDKLSKAGIEANFAGMMAKLAIDNRLKPSGSKYGLNATHIDSWENGSQNWTARMREEFQAKRGYDLLPFLPVMTGRVVDSLEVSERFLWDLRRTISELVITNYAGRFRELAHAHGMRFTAEAYGSPCDVIPYAGQADEPMGEFWTPSGYIESCRAMASAAHVYGKPIIGAEAFTAGDHERWREHPAVLKHFGDEAFCEGINRFVFHRYAMQPWPEHRVPGMTMGPWGQHYERTQTWWEHSADWHLYLARCQFLLRQGLFAADICHLQPETPPHGPGNHRRAGYGWDDCSAEVVLSRMSAQPGRILLPDGMRYRVLALPNTRTMTPELLTKIRDLVLAGATIIGNPPKVSPSLARYPSCDAEVARLARELWGPAPLGNGPAQRAVGQGLVVSGTEPEAFLRAKGLPPDFSSNHQLRYIHRVDGDTDLYFVANPWAQSVQSVASFRVDGKLPEFWWPDSGRIQRGVTYETGKGITSLSLNLEPHGSVFVLFRKPVNRDSITAIIQNGSLLVTSTPEPPPQITVQRALYGVPGEPTRSRDVRAEVQQKVDSAEYSFPVKILAEAGDPAFGSIKTLSVDYTVDNKPFSAKAQDPQTIHLSGRSRQITIHKAVYGLLNDPQRTRDVREKLQRIFDAGETFLRVSQMAAGDDPAYQKVKTLVVEYALDGKPHTFRGTDREVFDLTLDPECAEPVIEATADTHGRWQARIWRNGVFQVRTTRGGQTTFAVESIPAPIQLAGPWMLHLKDTAGTAKEVRLDKLVSWADHPDPVIRWFSGTATYRKEFTLEPGQFGKANQLTLDLGEVQVIARVRLNEKSLGTLWKRPYRVELTDAARKGKNHLEIEVVNLWPNRLIGDEFLPEDSERNPNGTLKRWPEWLLAGKPSPAGRQTFTSWRLWKKEDAPLPSGLIGPVQILSSQTVPLKID
ncbi:MAG TPA: glycosyl hydrolase [Clostridia bacterium]|nr:glycosyl hydrolase [Clostridia bacterium]